MKRLLSSLKRLLLLQALTMAPLVAVKLALSAAGIDRVPAAAAEVRVASLGEGYVLKSEAAAFRGGSVAWLWGGFVFDLRGATLAPEGADLRIVTVMGGTVIIVPPDWPIDLEQRVVLGGAKPPPPPESDVEGPALRITARVVMGGLDIVRRAPGEEIPAV